MGCTNDYININLKTKEMAINAIKLFTELLKKDLYDDSFYINERNIEKKENGFLITIDEEPLFKTWNEGSQIEYFVKEFIKKFPDEYFYLNNTASFNNCGDTTYYEYTYNEKEKELTTRIVCSDDSGLYICPKCDADFDGEALVYIEDYKKGKTYTCPVCGEEISFEASESIVITKLENLSWSKKTATSKRSVGGG